MPITLVILAAGMGSRFGGDKQIEPVGPNGELLIDYSVIDAAKVGFGKVVFVIKKEIEQRFRETVFASASKHCDCEYVFQNIFDLPEGFLPPAGRIKPWGTGHAVLSARKADKTPFAVINADDFYGRGAFEKLAGFLEPLSRSENHATGKYCMVGYRLENTVSEYGSVSRGICKAGEDGYLESITERTSIYVKNGGIYYSENGAEVSLPRDTIVSMNCFGFTQDFFEGTEKIFAEFLENGPQDPMKSELHLPFAAARLISSGKAKMRLLTCGEKWYGFTYREDRETVVRAIAEMTRKGIYK